MNNWNGIGRLTRDIDLSYSKNGVAVGAFTLAVNRKFKNEQGEYEADFIRCKAFKKTAEIIAEYVKKGHQLAVSGHIQTGSYQNNEGQTIYTTDIIVDSFTFVESRNGQNNANTANYGQGNTNTPNQSQSAPNSQANNNQSPFQSDGAPIDISDDDLPF